MSRLPLIILIVVSVFVVVTCTSKPEIDVTSFYKPVENPILSADDSFTFNDPVSGKEIHWQKADVFNPAAIVRDNKVYLLFRAEDNPSAILGGRTSRIGIAESDDGIRFKKFATPVLYPDNDRFSEFDHPGGCEDPRVSQTRDGRYIMAYTSWNYDIPRLSIAFSNDLFHWEKKGPAFARALNGKFNKVASKSGSMITAFENGKQVLAKIDGKYWMYWGEHLINLAWSENLYDWNPATDPEGNLKAVARPRPGKFDSNLTECGPPAILTSDGIVLLYNGKNADDGSGDSRITPGTYTVGQIIFDPKDPAIAISRSDTSFLRPTLPHERTGQYKAGTIFSEALVKFHDKWFLYYGTADSFVGVAVTQKK